MQRNEGNATKWKKCKEMKEIQRHERNATSSKNEINADKLKNRKEMKGNDRDSKEIKEMQRNVTKFKDMYGNSRI